MFYGQAPNWQYKTIQHGFIITVIRTSYNNIFCFPVPKTFLEILSIHHWYFYRRFLDQVCTDTVRYHRRISPGNKQNSGSLFGTRGGNHYCIEAAFMGNKA